MDALRILPGVLQRPRYQTKGSGPSTVRDLPFDLKKILMNHFDLARLVSGLRIALNSALDLLSGSDDTTRCRNANTAIVSVT
jgi:hypothetical protein